MPVAKVQMPDGRIGRFEVPEGTTPQQVEAFARQQFELTTRTGQVREMSPAAQQIANDPISKGARNFAEEVPGYERALAGAGKAFTDIGRGALQAGFLEGVRGVPKVTRPDIDESRRLDQSLMSTPLGVTGNIVGNIAATLPTLAIPGANTYTGAAAIGGALGALQPLGTGDSRLTNTALGAGAGVAGQAMGNAIGRGLKPVSSSLTPEQEALAQSAERYGIPLSVGQRTGSKPLQITESVLENLPFTSAPQIAGKNAQQSAFNRAVGSTFGESADALTPQVMGQARSRLGQTFTDLSQRNTLIPDDQMLGEVRDIVSRAQRFGAGDVPRIVSNFADELNSKVTSEGGIPGMAYRQFDSLLGRTARGATGDLRNYLGELQSAVRSAMDRSISEADQQAWKLARQQYANLATVAPIAAKSEVGNVSGRTLLNAANNASANVKYGRPSELAELGRIGRQFVAERIPDSGTSQRNFITNAITGNVGGAAIGAPVGALMNPNDPWKGAAMGSGLGALGGVGLALGGPKVVQSALTSELGRKYLTRGIVDLTDAQRAALANTLRTGALSYIPVQARQ